MINQTTAQEKYHGRHHQVRAGDSVIALHCAGGNAKQWRGLAQDLGKSFEVLTPEHYGTATNKQWPTGRMLSLANEAEHSLQLIDRSNQKVHLVGHSYGGALALHIALARPERIASISLYEPCAFDLLRRLGSIASSEICEINSMAAEIYRRMNQGDSWGAMQNFVDYWSGEGAWLAMKPEHRDGLLQWAPNAVNAFDALFSEVIALSEYQALNVPVQLIVGGQSPDPVRAVSTTLSELLPNCRIDCLPGVGHMGPLTHADAVNLIITRHIESHSTKSNSQLNKASVALETAAVAA